MRSGPLEAGCGLIFIALVTYEYVITFTQEVSTVWRRRFTVTSFLLLSIRYILVASQVIALANGMTTVCAQLLPNIDLADVCSNTDVRLSTHTTSVAAELSSTFFFVPAASL